MRERLLPVAAGVSDTTQPLLGPRVGRVQVQDLAKLGLRLVQPALLKK